VVVLAGDLTPSQTASMDRAHVLGIATDAGGRTSHTAIVARALSIPAVVGVGGISQDVAAGDTVIIDGNRGVVIINPDPEQVVEHQEAAKKSVVFEHELAALASGDIKRIEEWVGKLDKRHATWLWLRLGHEKW
jgi:phosphotransferase system enzyme I (PtsI)